MRDLEQELNNPNMTFEDYQIEDFREALTEEREHNARLSMELQQMIERNERLYHHLRHGIVPEVLEKLADYICAVGDYDLDNPPADPFPNPVPEPKPKRARRSKA